MTSTNKVVSGIIVKGLQAYHTEEMIIVHMQDNTGIKKIILPRDYQTNESRGYAFIEFINEDQAINARKNINFSKIYSLDKSSLQVSLLTNIPKNKNIQDNLNFIVQNIPANCTEKQFDGLCGQYGVVASSKLVRSNDQKQVKFGYVSFLNSQSADEFFKKSKENQVKLENQILLVQHFQKNIPTFQFKGLCKNKFTESELKSEEAIKYENDLYVQLNQTIEDNKLPEIQYKKIEIKAGLTLITLGSNERHVTDLLYTKSLKVDNQIIGVAINNNIYLKDYKRVFKQDEIDTQEKIDSIKDQVKTYLQQQTQTIQPICITVQFNQKMQKPYAFLTYLNNVQAEQTIQLFQKNQEFLFEHQNIKLKQADLQKKYDKKTHIYIKNLKSTIEDKDLQNVLVKIEQLEVQSVCVKSHPNYNTKYATIVTKNSNKLDILKAALNNKQFQNAELLNLFQGIPKIHYLYPKQKHQEYVKKVHNNLFYPQPQFIQNFHPYIQIPQFQMQFNNQFQPPQQYPPGMAYPPMVQQQYHQSQKGYHHYQGQQRHQQNNNQNRYQQRFQNQNNHHQQRDNNNSNNQQRNNNFKSGQQQQRYPNQQQRNTRSQGYNNNNNNNNNNYNNNNSNHHHSNNNNNNNRQHYNNKSQSQQHTQKKVENKPKQIEGKVEQSQQQQAQQITIQSIVSKLAQFKQLQQTQQIQMLGQVLYPKVQKIIKNKQNINKVVGMLVDLSQFTIDEIIELIQNDMDVKERVNEAESLINDNA